MHKAIAEGLRCVRDLPPLRAIVARGLAFTLAGSAIWALMPLVARDLTGGGPQAFGLLLAALGLGAVIGAAVSHEVRRRFRHETILRAASLVFGGACLIVAARPGFALSFACWSPAAPSGCRPSPASASPPSSTRRATRSAG